MIPQAPIDNRKRGFSIPLSKWLKEDLKDQVEEAIFSQQFLNAFSISEKALMLVWQEHQRDLRDHKWFYSHNLFTATMAQKLRKIKILFTIPNFDTAGSESPAESSTKTR